MTKPSQSEPDRYPSMHKVLLKVYSSSLFYSLVTAMEAMVPFVLAPVLTRLMKPESYGLWDLFVIFMTFLRPIVSLTIQDSLKMRYYDLGETARSRFISTAFILTTFNAGVICFAIWWFHEPLGLLLKFPGEWLISIVITAYLMGLFYSILTYNQFAEDKKNYVAMHALQSIASILLIFILLTFGLDWQGAIIGKICALCCAVLAGILWCSPKLKKVHFLKPDRRYMGELVRFGLFYLPTGLGIVAVGLIDRVIISQVYDVAMISFYGIAALFGKVLLIAINSFILAWMPWLFQKLRKERVDREVLAISASYLVLVPLAGLILYSVSIFVAPILIGNAFHQAFVYIPWAITAVVLEGFFFHNQAFLHFKKRLLLMSLASGFAIISNIILTLIFIYPYGVAGVFAATCLSYVMTVSLNAIMVIFVYRNHHNDIVKT